MGEEKNELVVVGVGDGNVRELVPVKVCGGDASYVYISNEERVLRYKHVSVAGDGNEMRIQGCIKV